MKIYDCFMLFDEIELLKIRLEELYDSVDYFVIVEATTNYIGEEKPLYFKKYYKNFERYRDKIIYIPVKHPKLNLIDKLYSWLIKKIDDNRLTVLGFLFWLGTNWKMESFQRTKIKEGFKECDNEDIIMLSDLDEIPNKEVFPKIRKKCKEEKMVLLEQKDYRYFLNGLLKEPWHGTKAITFRNLKKYYFGNPARIRYGWLFAIRKKFKLNPKIEIVKNAGWHFSYLGNLEKVLDKVKYFSSMSLYHCKKDGINPTDKEYMRECINKGIIAWEKGKKITYVKIDKTFPKTIYNNQKRYKHLVKF